MPRTVQAVAPEAPNPRKFLNPGQTKTLGHPHGTPVTILGLQAMDGSLCWLCLIPQYSCPQSPDLVEAKRLCTRSRSALPDAFLREAPGATTGPPLPSKLVKVSGSPFIHLEGGREVILWSRDFTGCWTLLAQGHHGSLRGMEGWTSLPAPRLVPRSQISFNNPFWN